MRHRFMNTPSSWIPFAARCFPGAYAGVSDPARSRSMGAALAGWSERRDEERRQPEVRWRPEPSARSRGRQEEGCEERGDEAARAEHAEGRDEKRAEAGNPVQREPR